MAVPKRKISVARRDKRRSHHALKLPSATIEAKTGKLLHSHRYSRDAVLTKKYINSYK